VPVLVLRDQALFAAGARAAPRFMGRPALEVSVSVPGSAGREPPLG
jgi:hypothetical protein